MPDDALTWALSVGYAPFMSPRQIGPWVLLRELGRGGMGAVFEAARQDQPDRRVALKLIHAREASPEALARFTREAQLLARVEHPGVVRIHDVGQSPAGPYLVMERIEGASLKELAARGQLAPAEAARIVRALADAVAAATGSRATSCRRCSRRRSWPATTTRCSTSRGPRRAPTATGPGCGCQRRPSGSWPRAASTGVTTRGGTTRRERGRTCSGRAIASST